MKRIGSLRTVVTSVVLLLCAAPIGASAAQPTDADLERRFTTAVRPFIESYCAGCHSGPKPAAQLDLRAYASMAAVVRDYPRWQQVVGKLTAKQMPPAAAKQPSDEERNSVIEWIGAALKNEARKNAGDPGVVLARRLSNSEYNYTVRDLTGVDIRPAKEFPVDPANPAGFDNSGESLDMSPALLNKYLLAARDVADHMVLKPNGLAFAPRLMLVETDRDEYCIQQIMDFYQRQDTDFGDYFLSAWRFKYRAALGRPKATLANFAAESKVSPRYLATVWRALEETKEEIGPLAKLQSMWRALPAPKANQPDLARDGSRLMRDFVVEIRRKTAPRYPDLAVTGISRTAQPFLMWRNRQYATHRTGYDPSVLQVEGEARPAEPAAMKKTIPAADNADEEIPAAQARKPLAPDADLHVPAGQRALYETAFARFSAVFPDAFYISERGRYFPDNTRDKGRHLSAGFHNLMGYFRDDLPLYEMILDDQGRRELDELWQEMDFVASANIRTYVQFYLFESREAAKGPEGAAAIPDKEITSEARIKKVKEDYLAKARPSENGIAIKAVEEHFESVNASIRWVEKARIDAEPRQLQALVDFAARAYRRKLSQAERDDLLAYYHSLRDKGGLNHEDAMRDSVVSILMSPDFCYRIDLVEAAGRRSAIAGSARPLSDYALASRLSYFVWSSMPDDELLKRAAAGELQKPEVLAAEARRMLKDDRALGLATEFGGNWLDFRRFEEHNAVDKERFPSFTNDLREAMFQEPVRYISDAIVNNRSILDFLYGNYTFVNPVLAQHYGMPAVTGGPDRWVRADNAHAYGRGGLLPMAVFLTKNAPGLRTSPVKRGHWLVGRVLGEQIPPPPAVVPELPRDEAKMDLPLRDMMAQHRADPMCSACHGRFDSFGLALEGYGPVGELRTKDLAGRPVDARATFPGGMDGNGMESILSYIRDRRQNDFVDNMCRKMLVYALGRSLILSDDPTIEEMRGKLAASGYRIDTLVESIVTSPQFRTKRVADVATRKGE